MSDRSFGAKQRFILIKRDSSWRSARWSPFVISEVLAARKRKLITARARKNKRSARMLANTRKDHSIPLKRYIPVHKISLSEEKMKSLLAFHTVTGCDTTSQFAGISKQSALKIYDSLSKLVEHLGEHCPPEESVLDDAEAFVCQLYNHGTDRVDINEERAAAFRKAKKNLDSLPPTKDTLHLHIRRANFQKSLDHPCLV